MPKKKLAEIFGCCDSLCIFVRHKQKTHAMANSILNIGTQGCPVHLTKMEVGLLMYALESKMTDLEKLYDPCSEEDSPRQLGETIQEIKMLLYKMQSASAYSSL